MYEMTHDLDEDNRIFRSGYVKGYHDALVQGPDPVEPEIRLDTLYAREDHPEMTFFCGACRGEMVRKYSGVPFDMVKQNYQFCHHCGRKVLWA